jgi:hypothetical protein
VGAIKEALIRRVVSDVGSYRVAISLGRGRFGRGLCKKSITTVVDEEGGLYNRSGSNDKQPDNPHKRIPRTTLKIKESLKDCILLQSIMNQNRMNMANDE